MATNPALVAHLYRRAGFGASPAQINALSEQSWTQLVDALIAGLSGPDTAGDRVPLPHLTSMPEANTPGYQWNEWQEYVNLIDWWVQRMVVTSTPLREKLVLLLHGQFPTSIDKVGWPYMMYTQNQLFRTLGPGSFQTLVKAVAVDPAMLIWLDADTSHKDAPNQNFARELMERFTMGAGTYSQEDVIQAARCFTGWELDQQTGEFYLNPFDHDYGEKTVLGHVGDLAGQDVIEIVTHEPASYRWVISRLWSWLAYPVTPASPIVSAFVAGYAANLNLADLLRAMFMHPAFVSEASLNGLVKQPIEFVVGALRRLGLSTSVFSSGTLQWLFQGLGQIPFAPPSVGGWGANQYWQSSGSAAGYIQLANNLANVANLTTIENHDGDPAAQVTATLSMLGLSNVSKQTLTALYQVAESDKGGSGPWPAQQLVTLALLSPEFVLN